jgi:hypothetical protein
MASQIIHGWTVPAGIGKSGFLSAALAGLGAAGMCDDAQGPHADRPLESSAAASRATTTPMDPPEAIGCASPLLARVDHVQTARGLRRRSLGLPTLLVSDRGERAYWRALLQAPLMTNGRIQAKESDDGTPPAEV